MCTCKLIVLVSAALKAATEAPRSKSRHFRTSFTNLRWRLQHKRLKNRSLSSGLVRPGGTGPTHNSFHNTLHRATHTQTSTLYLVCAPVCEVPGYSNRCGFALSLPLSLSPSSSGHDPRPPGPPTLFVGLVEGCKKRMFPPGAHSKQRSLSLSLALLLACLLANGFRVPGDLWPEGLPSMARDGLSARPLFVVERSVPPSFWAALCNSLSSNSAENSRL